LGGAEVGDVESEEKNEKRARRPWGRQYPPKVPRRGKGAKGSCVGRTVDEKELT